MVSEMTPRRLVTLVLSLALASTVYAGALLAPGDAFPAWTLTDQTGATVSSRDLAGKTYLLWFYPKAMTPGCTAEGRGLRDSFADFRERHVEVLGVSFDPPAQNQAFVDTEHFPFRLLSDGSHTLAVAVGAADSPAQPVARRISYLVGPDGKVRAVYGSVTPAGHARDVLADLGAVK
jgi:thioredoxin-dependent peroxiredoxin